MDEGDDDPDREAILERRRKFIAVALAGLTGAAGCGDEAAHPATCLTAPQRQQQQADPAPQRQQQQADPAAQPCLEWLPPGEHEGTEEGASEEGSEEGSAETNEESENARPRVCLAPVIRSPLQPCLSEVPPPEPADDEADGTEG